MKNRKIYIVTTTINSPTIATLKFCERTTRRNKNGDSFRFIIVGDTKTPHDEYNALMDKYPNVLYLSPELQEQMYPDLSEVIGWRKIQRRNIGYVFAYDDGCDILASVDDDNIPYDNWGEDIFVGQDVIYDEYRAGSGYFDPLSITKDNHLWHRGYPIEYLQSRHEVEYRGKNTKKCLVQADLWDGDPDIDAICRLTFKPCVKYSDITEPYGANQPAPFNSQNTFIDRSVIPWYAVLPFTGRMDDIWGSYIVQAKFPNSVIYNKATVYQDRNVQDLVTNLENEIIGYRNTLRFIDSGENFESVLPEEALKFWKCYRNQFKGL